MEIVDPVDDLAVEAQHNVAHLQAGASRGRATLDALDTNGARVLDLEVARCAAAQRHGGATESEVAATNLAMREELAYHPLHRVDPDREADALRAGNDRGVKADHLACGVHERTAGVAGI